MRQADPALFQDEHRARVRREAKPCAGPVDHAVLEATGVGGRAGT